MRRWPRPGRVLSALVLSLLLAATACTGDAPARHPASESHREGTVPTLPDLDTGGPPRLAYAAGRVLVLPDGSRIRTPRRPRVVQQGGLVAIASTIDDSRRGEGRDGARTRVQVVVGTRLVEITRDADGPPVVSGDGAMLAWSGTAADGRAFVEGWSAATGVRGARTPVDFRPLCCTDPFVLRGLDDAGTAYGTGHSTWAVDLHGRTPPREVGAGGPLVLQVTGAGGIVATGNRATVFGHLDGGRVRPTATLPGWVSASVSPSESSMVSLTGTGVVVHDLAGGEAVTVLETGDEDVDIVGWEDGRTVLLDLHGGAGRLWVRCRTDGDCEFARSR